MSQTQLAAEIGIRQTALANYENGNRKISIDLLTEITRFYGISLDALVNCNGKRSVIPLLKELSVNELTESEINELANYARYLIYKRNDVNGESISKKQEQEQRG